MLLTFSCHFSVSEGDGIHWFVLCHRERGCYEIFNSLGSTKEYVRKLLNNFRGYCEFNETAVQAPGSTTCGLFCIFFIIQRYFNEDLSMQDILNENFSANLSTNEQIVATFFRKHKINKSSDGRHQ